MSRTRVASAARTRSAATRSGARTRRSTGVTTYQSAVRFLYDRMNVEKTRPTRLEEDVFKLDRMRALMGALDNPHDALRCVHVAGTKGKGSTCEMTTSCLTACGYTVGLYTSPHLVDVRERVRIGDRLITQSDFTRLMKPISEAVSRVEQDHGQPTFFEVSTAVALLYFADHAVDVAVVECGLGGRLDSTNVITPEVTAVTAIGLDHTEILGDTPEKIAREKAGIFKPGVPALTFVQPAGVLDALQEVADAVGAPLSVVGRDIDFSSRFESTTARGPHTRVSLTTERSAFEHLPVPLMGEHQAHNCGLALAILDRLAERGFNTPETAVLEGLERTRVAGRMELAWKSPRIILDIAHNPESVRALVKAIGAHIPYDSMVAVFGCCADKDVAGMLDQIGLGADKIIFTRSKNPRSADPRALQKQFVERSGRMSQTDPDLPSALRLAASAVARDDLICVTGSAYLVGEARKHLIELEAAKQSANGTR